MAFHSGNLSLDLADVNSHNNHIAGSTIFLISTIGVMCNSYVVFVISRRPSMQNAFGKLSQNQGVADMLSSFLYLTYYAPMVFFDIKLLQELSVTRWFGFTHLVIYDGGNLIHFFASINRAVVIFFPMTYGREFGIKTARMLNCLAWVLAIVPGFLAYQYPGCPLVYDSDAWHYNFYSDNEVCQIVGLYYTLGKSLVIISIILSFDFVTFTKSRFLRKELRVSLASNAVKARKLDELNFVTQALLQGIVFGAELISYFFLATYTENRWIKFVLTQVAWQLTQTLDGIIAICFNKEFRHSWRRKRTVGSVLSHSQPYLEPIKKITTTS